MICGILCKPHRETNILQEFFKHSQAGRGPLIEHFWLRGKGGEEETKEKLR